MPPKSHRGKRGNRRGAGNSSQTENTLGCKEIKNDSTIIDSAPIPSTHVKMVYIPPPPPPTQSNKITSLEFMSLLHSLEVPSSSSTTYHAQGIENPKNLCFRNVIVQSLLAVTPFRNFLQNQMWLLIYLLFFQCIYTKLNWVFPRPNEFG